MFGIDLLPLVLQDLTPNQLQDGEPYCLLVLSYRNVEVKKKIITFIGGNMFFVPTSAVGDSEKMV